MNYKFRNIEIQDIDNVKNFTDKWIGSNYFTKAELRSALILGVQDEHNASFLALDNEDQIIGIRITYLPGEWIQDEHLIQYVTPHEWKAPKSRVAYFKSHFVTEKYQHQGIGRELNLRSLEVLSKLGVLAVACHAWVESPANSSIKHLEKMKFEPVATHKNFWFFHNYECIKCAPKNCECSAQEMIYYLPIMDDEEEEEIILGRR